MKRFLFLFILLLCAPILVLAQGDQLTTKSKKAAKYYLEARNYYDSRQNDEAVQNLLMAIKEDPNFIEAHALLGYVYEDMGKNAEAIVQLKQVLQINPNFYATVYFSLGRLELSQGDYQEAQANYEKF